jgi:hypothetical protein
MKYALYILVLAAGEQSAECEAAAGRISLNEVIECAFYHYIYCDSTTNPRE